MLWSYSIGRLPKLELRTSSLVAVIEFLARWATVASHAPLFPALNRIHLGAMFPER
jgi:hypothetical protein